MDNNIEVENLIQLLDHYGIPISCPSSELLNKCKNTLFKNISGYAARCINCKQIYHSICKRREVKVTWITI